MKSLWAIASIAVWTIALWAGIRASAQQCTGCTADGIGQQVGGVLTLGNCGSGSYCMFRNCAALFTYTDGSGVVRCAHCYKDSSYSTLVSPQSALACLVFVWQAPGPCVCPYPLNPQGGCG